MFPMLDLPVEILLLVYQSLDSIDDALHLARTCTHLHTVFGSLTSRLEIFRAIIDKAPQHVFDAQISVRVQMREHFYREFPLSPVDLAEFLARKAFFTTQEMTQDSDSQLRPETVWEIVCRWHAMRLLFNLYADSSVSASYSQSAFPHPHQREREELVREGALLPPAGSMCQAFVQLSPRQKYGSYKRFYKALTAQWLATEADWEARARVYDSELDSDLFCTDARKLSTDNKRLSLAEKLDRVEVADFLWGFLARKPFPVSSLESWLEGDATQLERYIDPEGTQEQNWLFFLQQASVQLRPPHIIELLLLSTWPTSQTWGFEKFPYLRRLGFCEPRDGVVLHPGQAPRLARRPCYPITTVEQDVENGVRALGLKRDPDGNGPNAVEVYKSQKALVAKWQWYRSEQWRSEARGKWLFFDENYEEMLERILRFPA